MSEPAESSVHESRFAELTGAPHAIAYAFARQALRGILRGIDLAPGDRVALAPLTCRVVVLALRAERIEPLYVDVDPDTLNVAPDALRAALAARPKAVLFQHTYGGSEGLADVARIADGAGVALIEDRAHCVPRDHALRGIAAIYSNNLRKPLPAASGGMATTRDPALGRALRTHAARLRRSSWPSDLRRGAERAIDRLLLPRFYWPLYALAKRTSPTYRRGTLAQEIAAEIEATARRPSRAQERAGQRWLARAAKVASLRSARAARYLAALERGAVAGMFAIPARAAAGPLYYFPVLVREKRALLGEAARAGLEVAAWPVWAPIFPLEASEALAQYGYAEGSCPVAERVARELVGLPTDQPERQELIDLLLRHAPRAKATHGVPDFSSSGGDSK